MPAPRDFGVPTNILHQLTIRAAGNAPTGSIIDWTGTIGVSGQPMGVIVDDAVAGRDVGVAMAGLIEVIAGAPIAVGQPIGGDGLGRGIPVGPPTQILGRAMSAAAAGQRFQMYITREGTN